jgi:hypothetical protein
MHALRLWLILLVVIAETGCGLPDQFYIASPSTVTLAGGTGNTFSFANPDHTSDSTTLNFKGFELYYKLYSTDNSSAITGQDYNANNTSDVVTQLTNAGYLPVCAGTDINTHASPLIPVAVADISSTFSVTVSVNQFPAGAISTASYSVIASGHQVNVEIRRNIIDNGFGSSGQFKTFLPNSLTSSDLSFVPADIDVSGIYTRVQQLGGNAYLAMYALSYGVQGLSTPIRSTPLFLGYVFVNLLN